MSDHAVDLHLATITGAPTQRPGPTTDPVAAGLLETLAGLDRDGPATPAARRRPRPGPAPARSPGAAAPGRAHHDRTAHRARRHRPRAGSRPGAAAAAALPVRDRRRTLAGAGAARRPRRRPAGHPGPGRPGGAGPVGEPPAPADRRRPRDAALLRAARAAAAATTHRAGPGRAADPAAGPARARLPRPGRLARRHARVAAPARPGRRRGARRSRRRPGAGRARRGHLGQRPGALARARPGGAAGRGVRRSWCRGPVFAAGSSSAWVGGALPLGNDEWVVLDADPDASGLKLDQHLRNLVRQYAGEANGDAATSAPGTLRSTGFALARRDRAAQLRPAGASRPRSWPSTTAPGSCSSTTWSAASGSRSGTTGPGPGTACTDAG